jgi:hypothetical protein
MYKDDGYGIFHRTLPGLVVLIPTEARQYIRNTGTSDRVFLAIVAPKWQASDKELVR